ncbi:hypothetical protein PWT90_03430 [Aphanocladium album]|nr:hypothetical protein PWT90_03430 [Aphanocladium album]
MMATRQELILDNSGVLKQAVEAHTRLIPIKGVHIAHYDSDNFALTVTHPGNKFRIRELKYKEDETTFAVQFNHEIDTENERLIATGAEAGVEVTEIDPVNPDVKEGTDHDQDIQDKVFGVVATKACSLARQGEEGREALLRMAANAKYYGPFEMALKAKEIQQSSKQSRRTLRISRLYPDGGDDALRRWLEDWVTARIGDQIEMPLGIIQAAISSISEDNTPGKGHIILMWAITILADTCAALDIDIPDDIKMRDLPCLLGQAMEIYDYQRQSNE